MTALDAIPGAVGRPHRASFTTWAAVLGALLGAFMAVLNIQITEKDHVVRPIDVLIGMQLLSRDHLEAWRRRGVPYLEKVIDCNLSRLSRLLRILRFHAHDLKLAPSATAYVRHGSGPKQRLRFTKTGEAKLEKAYCTHFVWPGKGPWHPPGTQSSSAD